MKKFIIYLITVLLLPGIKVFSQPPGYYNGTKNLSGAELKKALHQIIKDHVDFTYSRAKDIINESDSDPANPGNVILFYLQESRDASLYGTGSNDINREHVWAKSHGNFSDIRPLDGDVHNLRPADASVNEDRGNKDFDNVQPYGFQHSEALECWYSDNAWEPGPATKGQVARILFYMAVRYEGDEDHGIDLEVADRLNTYPLPEHGRLSALIEWNNQYPPSDFERRRNEIIFQTQQNRNPFIDHPEFADLIWNNESPHPIQFAEFNMIPEKPHAGEDVMLSLNVQSELETDSVILFWGNTFDSKEHRKKLTTDSGKFSGLISLPEGLPGQTLYFLAKAYVSGDSALTRGSYILPEKITPGEITPVAGVQGSGNESPLIGQKVTVAGRVTANFDNTLYIQDASSERSGICIFNSLKTGKPGDSVVVRGMVAEYNTLTELSDIEYFYNYGNNKTVKPLTIDSRLLGEDYEGMLVTLDDVIFEDGGSTIPLNNRSYSFSDEYGQGVLFSEWSGRLPGKKLPAERTSITGIVSQYRGNYQLLARSITDLSVGSHNGLLSAPAFYVLVYPNPATNRLFIKSDCNLKSVSVSSSGGSCQSILLNNPEFIDVSNWQKGLYILRFETEKHGSFHKKIIVR